MRDRLVPLTRGRGAELGFGTGEAEEDRAYGSAARERTARGYIVRESERRCAMMCLLTERRLKPGTFEQFRAAWEPEEHPRSLIRAYHLRDEADPDHVISFGFFDLSRDEFDEFRQSSELQEMQRARFAAMAEFVAETGVDAVFQVADIVDGPSVAEESSGGDLLN